MVLQKVCLLGGKLGSCRVCLKSRWKPAIIRFQKHIQMIWRKFMFMSIRWSSHMWKTRLSLHNFFSTLQSCELDLTVQMKSMACPIRRWCWSRIFRSKARKMFSLLSGPISCGGGSRNTFGSRRTILTSKAFVSAVSRPWTLWIIIWVMPLACSVCSRRKRTVPFSGWRSLAPPRRWKMKRTSHSRCTALAWVCSAYWRKPVRGYASGSILDAQNTDNSPSLCSVEMRELNTSEEKAFFVSLLFVHFQEISISSLPAFPFLFLSSPCPLSRCTLRKLKRKLIDIPPPLRYK